jgi:hypothetical protein
VAHHIFAIDPGLATGVAHMYVDDDKKLTLLEAAELSMFETGEWLDMRLFRTQPEQPNVHVVCERFTISAQTATKSQAPWSLETIGMVRWLAHEYNIEHVTLQTPSDAKGFAPNPRLKAMGLWHKGGEGHALDAIRHGVVFAVNKKLMDLSILA